MNPVTRGGRYLLKRVNGKTCNRFYCLGCMHACYYPNKGDHQRKISSFWVSTKLAAPLDATEKKLAISAGVLFLIGVITLISSF